MRTVPEWIGKTPDTPIPDRVKLRVFLRFDGICQCGCKRKIVTGEPWDCDHTTALILGGENRESNLAPFLRPHHLLKTVADIGEKAFSYRKRKAHYGLKKSKNPMPGSRSSKWKKKMDGSVVRRTEKTR